MDDYDENVPRQNRIDRIDHIRSDLVTMQLYGNQAELGLLLEMLEPETQRIREIKESRANRLLQKSVYLRKEV